MFLKNLITAAVILGFTSIASAEHKTKPDSNSEFQGMYWSQLPVICGTNEKVEAYLNHYNFKLDSVSMGRENAQSNTMRFQAATESSTKRDIERRQEDQFARSLANGADHDVLGPVGSSCPNGRPPGSHHRPWRLKRGRGPSKEQESETRRSGRNGA